MYDLIIIRYGEIGLKGDNINDFITQLVSNIERATSDLGDFEISTVYGRIFLYAESDQIEKIVERLVNVPGIISLSPAQRFRIGKKISVTNAKGESRRKWSDHIKELSNYHGINLSDYKQHGKHGHYKLLANCVHPKLGLHVFNAAKGIITKPKTEQQTLF